MPAGSWSTTREPTPTVERFEALEELLDAGEGHLGKLGRSHPARQLVP